MDYGWHDFAGNVGVALVIGCYLALQLERIDARSVAYSALNGAGAALVVVSLLVEFNLSAFIVEGFWLLISLYGLFNRLARRRSH